MFRVGELDQRIDFLIEVDIPDGMGGNTTSTQAHASRVYCKVRPMSGKESERFDKLNATETTLFVTRYRTDITEQHRISWNGEEYNIRHIPRKDTRSMYSEFYAERGVAQ